MAAAMRAVLRAHVVVRKLLKPLELTLQNATKQATKAVQDRAPNLANKLPLRPAYANQPIHPRALLKQSRRWLSSSAVQSVLRELNPETPLGTARRALKGSKVYSSISQSTGRAPFAHTLRPNLTGGALPRTAGGYGLGSGRVGGARYFSHTPQAPAQVVHNVSQAMRAFAIGGGKVQYDGVDGRGEKRFRAVTALQDKATSKIKSIPMVTPGSFIDYNVNPTITALTPLGSLMGLSASKSNTLNSDGLIDCLSVDFARALKDLLIILEDIKSLSSLGDLPITYRPEKSCLRVHFPGTDAGTVEKLMEELGLRRGVIGQDPEFNAFVGTEIALLFPFAPSKSPSEYSYYSRPLEAREEFFKRFELPSTPRLDNLASPDFSTISDDGRELFEEMTEEELNPWLSSPSGFNTIRSSEFHDSGHPRLEDQAAPLEYQSFEGIYRFLELCDDSRR